MERTGRMEGIFGNYYCNNCNQSHSFSEKIPSEKVRRFYCPHFNIIIILVISKGLKIKVTTSCNKCFKEYNSELKLGCLNAQHKLITEDFYTTQYCGNQLNLTISLSEEYFDQNESKENYDAPNYNNMSRLPIIIYQ